MTGRPYTKADQLGRGSKKQPRHRATKADWEKLRQRKDGPCRICGGAPPNELHHLVPRGPHLGSDTPANLVPLCRVCHRRVTDYDREACATLRLSLTDAEYSYAVDKLGDVSFEARYPVAWDRTS